MAFDNPELIFKVGANVDGFKEAMGSASDSMLEMLEKVNPEIAGLVTAVVGVGTFAGIAGIEFEDAFTTIERKTGEEGEALESLKTSLSEAFSGGPDAIGKVTTVLDELHVRLGLVGEDLTTVTTNSLDLARITNEDAGPQVLAITRAFNDWQVATEDIAGAQNFLLSVAQQTGANLTQLAQDSATYGPTFHQLGLDFQEAASFLGQLQLAVPDAGTAMAALKVYVSNLALAGIDAKGALQDLIEKIKEAPDPTTATAIAIQDLGKRGGEEFAAAVLSGRMEFEHVIQNFKDAPTDIKKVSDDTKTLGETWVETWNHIKTSFGENGLVSGTLAALKDALNDFNHPKFDAGTSQVPEGMSDAFFKGMESGLQEATTAAEGFTTAVVDSRKETVNAVSAYADIAPVLDTAKVSTTGQSDALAAHKLFLEAAKDSTHLLSEAAAALSQDAVTLHIPTILSLSDATERAKTANDNLAAADAAVKEAQDAVTAAQASGDPTALKAANEELTAALADRKTKTNDARTAHEDLTATETASKQVTSDLAAAERDYAQLLSTLTGPALGTMADLEGALKTARENGTTALANIKTAEDNLVAARASGDPTAIKNAEVALDGARTTAKTTLGQIKTAETDVDTIRRTLDASTQTLITTEKALDTVYNSDLYPHTNDLKTAIGDLETARETAKTKTAELMQAEIDLNTAIAAEQAGLIPLGSTDGPAAKAKQKKEELTAATSDLKQQESNLATQFGLSKAQIDLLTPSVVDNLTQSQALDLAVRSLGGPNASVPSLTAALAAADAALGIITTSGGTYLQGLAAQKNELQAQIALWTGTGNTIPAATQIGLAQINQSITDFNTTTVTRWGTMWQGIHDDVTGAFTSMDKDLTSGNWGNIPGDWTKALSGMGDSVLTAFTKPASQAIATFISTALSDLITGTGSISAAWTQLGKTIGDSLSGASKLAQMNPGIGGQGVPGLGPGGSPNIPLPPPNNLPTPPATPPITGPDGLPTGGDASGGAAGSVGSLVNTVTGVVTAIASVATAIEGAFSIAEESNMKQSLNEIHNDTTMMNWKISNAGGVFDTSSWTANNTHMLLQSFNDYREWLVDSISDYWIGTAIHLGAIRYENLPNIQADLEWIGSTGFTNLIDGFGAALQPAVGLLQSIQAPVFSMRDAMLGTRDAIFEMASIMRTQAAVQPNFNISMQVKLDTGQIVNAVITELNSSGF